MEDLIKATSLVLHGGGAVINGRYTTSVRDVIDEFRDGYEMQIIRRGLMEDCSGTYIMLLCGFLSRGRKMLASGISLPEVLEKLEEPLELIKSNDTLRDLLYVVSGRDIAEVLLKYEGRYILIEDGDSQDDYILEDTGYRVAYKSNGLNKKDSVVLVQETVKVFEDVEFYFGGIVICCNIEQEALQVLKQMEITLVLVNKEQLYDLHHLMECDSLGKGLGSVEVFWDYVILQGGGDLPYIPKGETPYQEGFRAIRRAGKEGIIIIYVGGVNESDRRIRKKLYKQGLLNMNHYSEGTIEGNGLGFKDTTNVIHQEGIDFLRNGRYGGCDSYYLVQKAIENAKSVSKELLSVGATVQTKNR